MSPPRSARTGRLVAYQYACASRVAELDRVPSAKKAAL